MAQLPYEPPAARPRTIRGRVVPECVARAVGRMIGRATSEAPVTAAELTQVTMAALTQAGRAADREWCGRAASALLRDAVHTGTLERLSGGDQGRFAACAAPA